MTEDPKITRTGEWKSDDILFSIAKPADSLKVFVGSSDFRVYLLDLSTESPERIPLEGDGHRSYVTGLALAGDKLISSSYDGTLIWWDAGERKQLRSVAAHDRWIRRVIATPDGTRAVSVADDMRAKIWDAESGELIASFTDHADHTPHHYPSMLFAVTVSPDGQWIATGDKTGHVAIWNASTLEKAGQVEAPMLYTWDPKQRRHSIGGVRSLAFSHDSTHIAVGGIGTIGNIDHLGGPSRVEIFRWESGEKRHEIEDNERKGLIEQLSWHPSDKWLLGVGGDHKGFVNLYDVASGKLASQAASDGHIHDRVLGADLTVVYTAGHNRIERWEVAI